MALDCNFSPRRILRAIPKIDNREYPGGKGKTERRGIRGRQSVDGSNGGKKE